MNLTRSSNHTDPYHLQAKLGFGGQKMILCQGSDPRNEPIQLVVFLDGRSWFLVYPFCGPLTRAVRSGLGRASGRTVCDSGRSEGYGERSRPTRKSRRLSRRHKGTPHRDRFRPVFWSVCDAPRVRQRQVSTLSKGHRCMLHGDMCRSETATIMRMIQKTVESRQVQLRRQGFIEQTVRRGQRKCASVTQSQPSGPVKTQRPRAVRAQRAGQHPVRLANHFLSFQRCDWPSDHCHVHGHSLCRLLALTARFHFLHMQRGR